MTSEKKFANKTVLVTGSGRGLGAATALCFAKNGANVVVNDLNEKNAQAIAEEIKGLGVQAMVSAHDVSFSDQAKDLFQSIKTKFGHLNFLINNAGITRDSLFHKMTEEKFDEVIRVNVKGVFNCAQLGAAMMTEQKQGRIVSLASVSALGNIGQANYSASKAAVIGMTRTMALELAKFGITVNAIAPGFFDSALTQAIPQDVRDKFVQKIPLRRMGKPEEIGSLAAFLCSEEAAYVTGQTFFMDGGLSIGALGI